MRKAASIIAIVLLLSLRASSGQFGMSTPLKTNTGGCLIAGWPMNEGSGTTFHDVTANHDDITVNSPSAITWQSNTGLTGTTPYWNGTGYGEGANYNLTNFTGTTPYSVMMWSNVNGQTIDTQLIGTSTFSSPFAGWDIFQNNDNALEANYTVFDIGPTLPTNFIQVVFGPGRSGPTTFITETYDGSQTAAGVVDYINGGTATTNIAVIYNTLTTSAANNTPVFVGAFADHTHNTIGALAYVAIYNCVLTYAQVHAAYLAGPQINYY